MVNSYGEYLTSEFGISPSTAILTVFIGCVCVYMLVKRQWQPKEKRMLQSSKALAELYGGELAWKRLNDYKAALAIPDDALDQTGLLLKDLLAVDDEQRLDLDKIQRVVEKLEMAGRHEGVSILQSAHVRHSDKSFLVHEIELALVEMLIYKGKPEEALKWECMDYQEIQFDARPPFFKAIVYGMMGNWEEAARYWDEFVDVRDGLISIVGEGFLPAGRLHRISDFEKFKGRVQNLLNEIIKAKK
ncbi:uncharacterized protein LOC114714324 [Neltuma alba]|uniref:uncharacterized protein LOC114714324 n=1 Tax=Neltuma alba TaxID=207710 RepID=UPI0010A4319C|nr:uncharacterized protein LOC114714324 [Prosopis alba]